jgi:hypothetical protein
MPLGRLKKTNQKGLKLNGTRQLLVCSDKIYTSKENTEASLFASKEDGLKVNAVQMKTMFCNTL